MRSVEPIEVYLELGQKRVFAGAIAWPGWCRSGRDEESALQALCEAGPRYGRALQTARLDFQPPTQRSAFAVIERLPGSAATDFGAPAAAPSDDVRPVAEIELQRFQALLTACWQAFDAATREAAGRTLRKGPRGGGRDLDEIVGHVLDGDASYLTQVGWKLDVRRAAGANAALLYTRQAIVIALAAAARGETPARGPRGGLRWTPRYFVRRVAWHTLDHAWEIEDRS